MAGDPTTHYTFRAQPVEVIDADTIEVLVDQGFNNYKRIEIRLKGVDTHETYGVKKSSEEYMKGMKEKRFVQDYVGEADHFEWTIDVKVLEKGKYGRWVSRVFKDGEDLSKKLIEKYPEVEATYE